MADGQHPAPIEELLELLQTQLHAPEASVQARLIHSIAREPTSGRVHLLGSRVVALGLSPDRWTLGDRCAGVAFVNDGEDELCWQLRLGCLARPEDLPLTALVQDGQSLHQIRFETAGSRRLDLPPLPPRSMRLIVLHTDRTWQPGPHDARSLGVSVDVSPTGFLLDLLHRPDPRRRASLAEEIGREVFASKIRLLGNQLVAAGLGVDHWTEQGEPAGVVYTNYEDSEVAPELVLTCNAPPSSVPVTAMIDDGQGRTTYTFAGPGSIRASLAPVMPHERRLYIVWTDRTWQPGPHDTRNLGINVNLSPAWTLASLLRKPDLYVRVKLCEAVASQRSPDHLELLGSLVLGVNLSVDHWTRGGEPAGLVVTNPLPDELVPTVQLGCHADAGDLPLTVTVDDGQDRMTLPFHESGEREVALAGVPPLSRRLYIISTDRCWSPGPHDTRPLGVSVHATATGLLRALLHRRSCGLWTTVAEELLASTVPGRLELAHGRALLLMATSDRWTRGTEPAALVLCNPTDTEEVWELDLTCHAPAGSAPVGAWVDDCERKQTMTFVEPGTRTLPVGSLPAHCCRLLLLGADRSWSPGPSDPRQLGVRVEDPRRSVTGTLSALLQSPQPETRQWLTEAIWGGKAREPVQKLLQGQVRAVGLTGDLWTTDQGPAGLVLANEAAAPLSLELVLGCDAPPAGLPLSAFVDAGPGGSQRHEVRFTAPTRHSLRLPPLPPGQKTLVIVETDRTWTPGTKTDQRQLGVRISIEPPSGDPCG